MHYLCQRALEETKGGRGRAGAQQGPVLDGRSTGSPRRSPRFATRLLISRSRSAASAAIPTAAICALVPHTAILPGGGYWVTDRLLASWEQRRPRSRFQSLLERLTCLRPSAEAPSDRQCKLTVALLMDKQKGKEDISFKNNQTKNQQFKWYNRNISMRFTKVTRKHKVGLTEKSRQTLVRFTWEDFTRLCQNEAMILSRQRERGLSSSQPHFWCPCLFDNGWTVTAENI